MYGIKVDLWAHADDIAQVNHKNTKKKEKNGEFVFHEKRGDPIPEYLCLNPVHHLEGMLELIDLP
jgi:hypothetical protein